MLDLLREDSRKQKINNIKNINMTINKINPINTGIDLIKKQIMYAYNRMYIW